MNIVNGTNHDEMIPLKFQLGQNYPNPFKARTKIKYCVAFKTEINISIFNSNGRHVKTLIDEEQEAGTYEIEFSVENNDGTSENIHSRFPNEEQYTPGIYYYQLKAGDYLYTKEMTLL